MDIERKAKHIDEIVKYSYRNGKIRTVKHIEMDKYYSGDPSEGFNVLCCDECYLRKIEHDDSFWYQCEYCDDNFCLHYDNFVNEDYSGNICLKCVLNIGDGRRDNQYLNCNGLSSIFLEYTNLQSLQIESLLKENARLQNMLDYQPGGKGFVEAKEHFEELSRK